ncbi:cobalt ABC transporter, inner membrane subunit CbiQ [Chloroherpeton thalassium ATCC 35110]|uniref:Cobalt ABC transporter, inner membrane subunit CbiQ n=1 Tax=Chloroherpeton thalassium (strain ATCC 35110 / GB-78) TaxID=517418 RepID=B3QW25_CHLT3|nr:cobalt ECF transporter T component CbiQ [Chloroherpeton thalassium]ACF14679.1 cobalt ABC transporter, inner membrane subunit CbiQ [Chloroherpeton thalassium ATCC 35110]
MFNLDNQAYLSRLREIDPMQKMLFALPALAICLWASKPAISLVVLGVMAVGSVQIGKTSVRIFLKLMLVPIAFLFIGTAAIAVTVATSQKTFIASIMLYRGVHVGISEIGLSKAVEVFFKALGAVSCLYFLALSTPMIDLLNALRKLRVPKLLCELMSLIYRFTFLFLETAEIISTAQNARLGNATLKSRFRSFGTLVSRLFVRAYSASEALYTGLEARGYQGDLRTVSHEYRTPWQGYAISLVTHTLLIALTVGLNVAEGGR